MPNWYVSLVFEDPTGNTFRIPVRNRLGRDPELFGNKAAAQRLGSSILHDVVRSRIYVNQCARVFSLRAKSLRLVSFDVLQQGR